MLFEDDLPSGLCVLRDALKTSQQSKLHDAVRHVAVNAPFSKPRTRSGRFSAELTNCGDAGWWSDEKGYRYERTDPRSGKPWPAMPDIFLETLSRAIADTPAAGFVPDACLINHYVPGAKMGLHQDRDEADFSHPIVTVCLGASADFWIGGFKRTDKPFYIPVYSGDVLVMGGDSRMRYHGVRNIYAGTSPLSGLEGRISLTFRKAF